MSVNGNAQQRVLDDLRNDMARKLQTRMQIAKDMDPFLTSGTLILWCAAF